MLSNNVNFSDLYGYFQNTNKNVYVIFKLHLFHNPGLTVRLMQCQPAQEQA